MDITQIMSSIFKPISSFLGAFMGYSVLFILSVVMMLLMYFTLRYKVKLDANYLETLSIKSKYYSLLRWILCDFLTRKERVGLFKEFGFTIYVGRQGSGKTISMIEYLDRIKKKYPKCLIVTNFYYEGATHRMEDWRDLLEIRNGEDGVVFAIDEIHSEYSSASWKDFPESLLSEISMQRKQRIKIVATSQVYSRIAKPIREQCFSVIHCFTYFNRLTVNVEYDAAEYSTADTPYQVKQKVKPIDKTRFVQSNRLRTSYDTYEKIERMKKLDFIPRHER